MFTFKFSTPVAIHDFMRIRQLFYSLCFLVVVLCHGYSQSESAPVYHTVSLGENLFRISLRYNVKLKDLKEWNSLSTDNIFEGQKLIVGYSAVPQPNEAPERSVAQANYVSKLESIVDQVEGLYYESMASVSQRQKAVDTSILHPLFSAEYQGLANYELVNEFNQAQINALKEDVGLGFYSSYTHNFRPGVFEAEDLFFKNRANIGLDWNLLSNGITGRNSKIEKLKIDSRINELLNVKNIKNENYVYSYNYFIYIFNKAQKKYLKRRISVINSFLEIASEMYLVRAMPWEEIVQLKSRREAILNMEKNLENYNQGFEKAYVDLDFDRLFDAERLPVLEILPDKIFSGVGMDSVNRAMLQLEKQRLGLDYKRNKDLRLRTYFRYNLFDSEDADIRTFGSVGATFTAPLFRNKRNQELQEKKLAVIESEIQNQLTVINNELMNHYYEYEYTLKQFIEFYGQKELILERLRREIAKDYLRDQRFTPLDAISLVDQLYSVDFELLDLKQKLYLKLLKIYTLLEVNGIAEIAEPLDLSNFFDKMVGFRAVYVWSNTAAQFDHGFLSQYLLNNDFERAFISTGIADAERDSLKEKFQESNLKVYSLFGDNEIIRTNTDQKLIDVAERSVQAGYDGLQLDIEPHVLTDWQDNKQQYLDRLYRLVVEARKVTIDKIRLSVSVPLHFPSDFIQRISGQVDELVLMAYERPDIPFIVDNIRDELRVAADKVSLAIRPEDFKDRLEMESFIKELIDATGIKEIVIHDLGALIKLDEKTILAK